MGPGRADERPGPGDAAALLDVPASGRGIQDGGDQAETEDRQEDDIELHGHGLEYEDSIPLVEPGRVQQCGGPRRAFHHLTKGEGARPPFRRLDDGGLLGPLGGLIDQDLADVHSRTNGFS